MTTTPFPYVVLVDTQDQEQGTALKLEAHEKGLLHRALSVVVYRKQNNEIEVLLQKRHSDKYHTGGLWSNTCCTHPQPNTSIVEEAKRCLAFEMGIESLDLKFLGTFIYRAEFDSLIEYELDHVFCGLFEDQPIQPNPQEVEEYKWVSVERLNADIEENPNHYTPWLQGVLNLILN
jgi:isopentenyl-diphosphate Delta-isomerase